ncbi:surface lipoprotein assembly modifier [Acidimangrovimonas pyrenivorans]|uniref:Surface lipoprotein assembly modifier n=1 Tax=Acidimangrovimonas pyrenivorans TaxID=2030798 RepID=A0ABV7ABU3_9RHOB
MRIRTAGLALALGLLAVAAPLAGQAKPVELSPAAMRAVGMRALAAGYAADAHNIALALLGRDPKDVTALLIRSRAARDLGHYDEARAAARKAWRYAETAPERYAAARVRAQALSSAGNRTLAQLWLRRAVENAPDERARALAVRDYRYVRSRNPWALHFSLSLSPSSNVNNGSSSSTSLAELPWLPYGPVTIELGTDAQALSGYVGQLGFAAVYRLPPSERVRTEFHFSGSYRHNWLSARAKAAAPMAKGSDYDFGAFEIGIRQEFRRSVKSLSIYHWTGTLGRNWYGGAVLSDYARLGLGAEHPLAPQLKALWDVSYEHQDRYDMTSRSADVMTGEIGLDWGLANRDRMRLSFGARDTRAAEAEIDNRAVFADLTWSKAKPVRGIALGLQLSAERRRYGPYSWAPNGRRDVTLSAGLTMVFTRVSYMGFSPSLDVSYSRTASNVGLYRSSQAGLLLGFRSQF